jgi:hypothetical protein
MRDMPLVLNVVWGKNLTIFRPGKRITPIPPLTNQRKKEKPRGNGAHGAEKT